jgi:hypothetical protein
MSPVPRDLGGLLARAKDGSITSSEVVSVVNAVESGDIADSLYTLIHIIARSRPRGAEPLLLRYLDYRADPQVAGLSLHTLGVQWRRFDDVRDFTLTALDRLDWDPFADVQDAAITVAGEILRERSDRQLLERLTTLAMESDKWTAGHRFGALAMALGASHSDVSGLSAELLHWNRESIEARALERLDTECS